MLTKCVKSRLQSGRQNAIGQNSKKDKNLGSPSSMKSIYLENRERLSIIMVVGTRFHSMTFSDSFIILCIHLKFSMHNTLITATQDYLRLHIGNSCLTN